MKMITRIKNKKILLLMQAGIILVFTGLAGSFAPREYLDKRVEIGAIMIAIWGVAITLFTFVQGLVQSCKTNLLQTNFCSQYIIDKFDKIDSIINHLAGDVKAILLISILYLNLSLFLIQIQNDIWQCIMVYTQYFLFGMVALALYDLMGAMLKLVKANQIINRDVILSMSEREKKKNEEQIETDLEQ